ncbi:uncharacterized protein K460DRAFT_386550 [Cucurbitaria berberidis CBS 394.84]|uniref:PRISE-like Rossmann-fold domain-containing protein n=1 Tax=Cucurbitaria berberidis CBS 394.84 TaxID=1168544 RepID=A0A9P4GIU0_9PLEO|nr:uncharacterized protein K460DRAFT_386550 [Cucurbitaria berberidis CBS 394.84]KAF1846254.1 hypothetical protein K460DRAFT_386550 [Cucurbitaria berberidis CBS 394.84]
MTTNSGHHALVIGASGLIGWAVVDQLLQPYPSPSPFRKVSALVNRPLELEDSFWPDSATGNPELGLISGVNLLCSDREFEDLLRDKVPDVASISHVYYFAFKDNPDSKKEVEINVGMMRRVVRVVKNLSSNFKFFVYPGGTRGYGIYRPEGIFTAPLVEEMADQLPEDYAKTVSYPQYRAMLTAESANAAWTWSEVIPDAIIGFTPNGSGFSLAGHWAMYLSTYRLVHGEGAEIPFPGVMKGYESLCTETSASTLARVAIFASLHPNEFRERIFNVADSATPGSMCERWPQITSFFGLKGVVPLPTSSSSDDKPSDFIKLHEEKWKTAGMKGIDIWNYAQLDSYGHWLTFDRQLSLKRLRSAGFEEERRPEEGWWEAFKMFRGAGMIQ